MSDEQLVALAKNGDSEATRRVLVRYRQFVRLKANSYFLAEVMATTSFRRAT